MAKGYNIHELADNNFQWGGFAKISTDITISRVFGIGREHSGIGRWVWTIFWGKSGIMMRVCTFYQPSDNSRYFGYKMNDFFHRQLGKIFHSSLFGMIFRNIFSGGEMRGRPWLIWGIQDRKFEAWKSIIFQCVRYEVIYYDP